MDTSMTRATARELPRTMRLYMMFPLSMMTRRLGFGMVSGGSEGSIVGMIVIVSTFNHNLRYEHCGFWLAPARAANRDQCALNMTLEHK